MENQPSPLRHLSKTTTRTEENLMPDQNYRAKNLVMEVGWSYTILMQECMIDKSEGFTNRSSRSNLAINGRFEDVIKMMVTPGKPEPKKVDKT